MEQQPSFCNSADLPPWAELSRAFMTQRLSHLPPQDVRIGIVTEGGQQIHRLDAYETQSSTCVDMVVQQNHIRIEIPMKCLRNTSMSITSIEDQNDDVRLVFEPPPDLVEDADHQTRPSANPSGSSKRPKKNERARQKKKIIQQHLQSLERVSLLTSVSQPVGDSTMIRNDSSSNVTPSSTEPAIPLDRLSRPPEQRSFSIVTDRKEDGASTTSDGLSTGVSHGPTILTQAAETSQITIPHSARSWSDLTDEDVSHTEPVLEESQQQHQRQRKRTPWWERPIQFRSGEVRVPATKLNTRVYVPPALRQQAWPGVS